MEGYDMKSQADRIKAQVDQLRAFELDDVEFYLQCVFNIRKMNNGNDKDLWRGDSI